MKRTVKTLSLTMVISLAVIPASVFPQGKSINNAVGDVQFELVGQVISPNPTTAMSSAISRTSTASVRKSPFLFLVLRTKLRPCLPCITSSRHNR